MVYVSEFAVTVPISMEVATPIKEGYLLFPPHGVLGQLKKSWQKKYCKLFKPSNDGIERLEIFGAEEPSKHMSVRIITLENCVKIKQDAQKQQPNVFIIVTKTGEHHLATVTEKEMLDWVAALQSVAFKDHCSRQTIEEDNDLYCSSLEDGAQTNGVFSVQLVASEASNRCGFDVGSYTLVMTSAALQLRYYHDQRLLATWPYCFIRRYGHRDGKFTFEAGRKCTTGEGDFHLEHINPQEIYRCISSKMKNMRKMLSETTPPSSGILSCGDNQFQAALSMEARSRSPLPPSPTSATQFVDMDFTAISQTSLKPFASVDSQTPNISNAAPSKPRPKPAKPPRKHIYPAPRNKMPREEVKPIPGSYRKLSDSDFGTPKPTMEYDSVEVRTEAWRTQGLNEMTHTENFLRSSDIDDEPEYSHCVEQPAISIIPKKPGGSKILMTQLSNKSETYNYDTLQHFGSTSKLNSNPGYKQIPLPMTSVKNPPPSFVPAFVDPFPSINEYDTVLENMQACRMADDSHLGYGMIRKKSIPTAKEDTQLNVGPNHAVYNDSEYALVEKQRKV